MTSLNPTKTRVGYACINLSLKKSFRNYRLATITKEEEQKITEVLWSNIRLFREIIEYNIKHNIYVYRLSSDLISFCTHPYIRALYQEKVLNNEEMNTHFDAIKALRLAYNLRISIHPSQFNVLSSPKKDVVERSIAEVNAQSEWIRRVGGQNVVLHMGGAYNNKEEAIKRFKIHLNYIDKSLISIENDDKTYNVKEVYTLCEEERLKWVYDYHHDRCYPSLEEDIKEMIKSYPPDKYHLSTGTPYCHSRPHADYISKQDFNYFVQYLTACNIVSADVIFEAKKKNQAIYHILRPCGEGYWQLEPE